MTYLQLELKTFNTCSSEESYVMLSHLLISAYEVKNDCRLFERFFNVMKNKSGFWCRHLGCLTGTGLVQRRGGGGGWGKNIDTVILSTFPSPPPWPNFPLSAYSLGKYFLAPSLQSYQIQDGSLNTKMCTPASKIRLHRKLCPGELSKVSVQMTMLR